MRNMGVAWRLGCCVSGTVVIFQGGANLDKQQPMVWVRHPMVSCMPQARQMRMGATWAV